ncbi:hypothetical protein L218DRAFT_809533, partial [Marasmius fiardii PR-910]
IARDVHFHDVLHVPDLCNNLLSPFHLTRRKGYSIQIDGNSMRFYHSGKLRFTATIHPNNAGRLNGVTIPQSEYAATSSVASTCPHDTTLVHRRSAHVNSRVCEHMIREKLVDGLDHFTATTVDPI